MIEIKVYCDCGKELDIDEGVHFGHETDYAQTEILLLKCSCGNKYSYWTDGSNMFEEDEQSIKEKLERIKKYETKKQNI